MTLCLHCVGSLANNVLCGVSIFSGKYTAEGINALCDALKSTTTLKSLKYALLHPQPCRQHPLTSPLSFLCSLQNTPQLGPKGAEALSEGLALNKSLTSLELQDNRIGPEGGEALGEALKDTPRDTPRDDPKDTPSDAPRRLPGTEHKKEIASLSSTSSEFDTAIAMCEPTHT